MSSAASWSAGVRASASSCSGLSAGSMWPAMLATTRPAPRAATTRPNSSTAMAVPTRSTAITVSLHACTGETPAATTTLMTSPSDAARSASARTLSREARSTGCVSTAWPESSSVSADAASRSVLRSASSTVRPVPCRRAIAKPIPPAPMTTTTCLLIGSGLRDVAPERLARDGVGLGAAALAGLQPVDGGHLVGVELEVEDVDVLGDALGLHGLGDDRAAVLGPPAEHDLGRRLAVRLRDAADHRILQRRGVAAVAVEGDAADRRPRLREDAVLLAEGLNVGLGEVGVLLDLVDGRDDRGVLEQPSEVIDHEV